MTIMLLYLHVNFTIHQLLRSRLLTDQTPVEAVVVDCHRVRRTPVETSRELYMESTGLLGATRLIDQEL